MKLEFADYLVEPFDSHGYDQNVQSSVDAIRSNQILPLTQIISDYNGQLQQVTAKQSAIASALSQAVPIRNAMMQQNDKYNYIATTDSPATTESLSKNPQDTLVYGNRRKPTILDAAQDDVNNMILEQNNIYILGSITVATLLIFVIYAIK